MTTASELLASLRQRAFQLWIVEAVDGLDLYVASASDLTADDREAIASCRPELVALLLEEARDARAKEEEGRPLRDVQWRSDEDVLPHYQKE